MATPGIATTDHPAGGGADAGQRCNHPELTDHGGLATCLRAPTATAK